MLSVWSTQDISSSRVPIISNTNMADGNTITTASSTVKKTPSSSQIQIANNNIQSQQHQQPNKLPNRPVDGKIGNTKHVNVIHRTTSESLRLAMNKNSSSSENYGGIITGNGGSDAVITTLAQTPPPSALMNSSSNSSMLVVNSTSPLNTSGSAMRKPKTSSFQITSVTVGTRASADNGDDSADDLDESHTTDDNSRITDVENETPSFSDDTFSKEDVFFSTNALGTAPVIPTSAQYGLAIVAPTELSGVGNQSISDVHVSLTDAGINIVGGSNKLDVDLNQRNERFKVVKIESTEPFKRGRWMCMDYLDHTTTQSTPATGGKDVTTNDSGVVLSENHAETDHNESPSKGVHTEIISTQNLLTSAQHLIAGQSAPGGCLPASATTSPGQTLQQPIQTNPQFVNNNSVDGNTMQQQQQQTSHGQTMPSHIPLNVGGPTQAQASVVANAPAQSLPPQQLHQIISQALPPQQQQQQQPHQNHTNYQHPSTSVGGSQSVHVSQNIPLQQIHEIHQFQQQLHNSMQQGQSPAQFYAQATTNEGQPPPQPQQHHMQQQQQVPSQTAQQPQPQAQAPQQQVGHSHGQTLPAGILHGMVMQNNAVNGANIVHPVSSQPQIVNVSHPQAMSLGHIPTNMDISLNATNNAPPPHTSFIPVQGQQQNQSQPPLTDPNLTAQQTYNGLPQQAFNNPTSGTSNSVTDGPSAIQQHIVAAGSPAFIQPSTVPVASSIPNTVGSASDTSIASNNLSSVLLLNNANNNNLTNAAISSAVNNNNSGISEQQSNSAVTVTGSSVTSGSAGVIIENNVVSPAGAAGTASIAGGGEEVASSVSVEGGVTPVGEDGQPIEESEG